MSAWDHRIVKTVDDDGIVRYGIHEVHYDRERRVTMYTSTPTQACTNTWELRGDCVGDADGNPTDADAVASLRKQLQWMLEALEKPMVPGALIGALSDEEDEEEDEEEEEEEKEKELKELENKRAGENKDHE